MSGVSYTGGVARCWHDWQKFMDCYTAKSTSDISACKLFAEDYEECLYHDKEKERAAKIAAEAARKKAIGADLPEVKVVKNLSSLPDLSLIK